MAKPDPTTPKPRRARKFCLNLRCGKPYQKETEDYPGWCPRCVKKRENQRLRKNARAAQYRAENREAGRAYAREYQETSPNSYRNSPEVRTRVRAQKAADRQAHLEEYREDARQRRAQDPAHARAVQQEWRAKNPERVRIKQAQSTAKRTAKRAQAREEKRQLALLTPKIPRRATSEFRQHMREISRERYRLDDIYRIGILLRTKLRNLLKRKKHRHPEQAMELVGCSLRALRAHLRAQFLPGMTWKNYGEWEVDHIQQVSTFDLRQPEQQTACFSYLNLRPLWKDENKRRPFGPNASRPRFNIPRAALSHLIPGRRRGAKKK